MGQFWNSSLLEPKRQHRWVVTFGDLLSQNVPSYVARKCDKPSFEINETQHKYFGHTFKYPGQVTWQDVSITIVDPVSPNATDGLWNSLRNAGYRPPSSRASNDGLWTVTKAAAVNAIGPTIFLQQLGAVPGDGAPTEVLETWKLVNPWLKDVKFGELSYDDDGIVEISMTIAYDYAEQSP